MSLVLAQDNSWTSAQEKKTAELELVWFTSNPFISESAEGKLTGAEFELMKAFKYFLQEEYSVDLKLEWKEAASFRGVLETIRHGQEPNIFGVSAFSITDERKEFIQFTDSYLPDITVLISSEGTPIMETYEEMRELIGDMKAVTIKETNYEYLLLDLRSKLGIEFEIQYIDSDENVLDKIGEQPNCFGFMDLPIYLMWIQGGSELTRQNFFTNRGTGYGFIMPQHSDWSDPFNEFLSNSKYKPKVAEIISKHIGSELYDFIDKLYEQDQLGASILTKEKEIQLALIKNANLKLEDEKTLRRLLIFAGLVTVVFLVIIVVLFLINQKGTGLLLSQKEQIENQKEAIRLKNEQLMNRNAQLIGLNEEKNNLMNILAHDLRSPLSNIIGFSSLYKDAVQITDGKNPMDRIESEANRMTLLITKILDTKGIENNQSLVLKESVDVVNVANEISARYRPIAAKKQIDLELVTSSEQVMIETDHMLLFLILDNLLSNAIKFSPSENSVEIGVVREKNAVVLKVKDNGPGFTEKDKKLMFNKFQRLSAQPTGDETSTGLGLSIVKKYVTDLGGKVWAESVEREGAVFYVSIPF